MDAPAPQPLPVEGQRPQWDVACDFCGVVSVAWNRPEVAAVEMRDHIAMHMSVVGLVHHQTPSVESEGEVK